MRSESMTSPVNAIIEFGAGDAREVTRNHAGVGEEGKHEKRDK